MRPLIAAGLMLIVVGCASTGPEPASYAPQSGVDSDAQTRVRIHTELAAGYLELGNYGVALQEAAEALKSDPNYAPALNVLGLVYMELRDDKAAEASFQRALRVSPLDSDSNNNYGWFLCQRKRELESIKYFLAALRNPLYATPDKSWVNAGICVRQTGDLAAAEEYFQKALKLRPTQPQALFQLADIEYKRKNYSEAKANLERMRPGATPNAEMLWLALRVERGLGNRNAEASLGFQLRKNFPDSREARALIAGQYE
jgi:type IV pilus assembly protein PilF